MCLQNQSSRVECFSISETGRDRSTLAEATGALLITHIEHYFGAVAYGDAAEVPPDGV